MTMPENRSGDTAGAEEVLAPPPIAPGQISAVPVFFAGKLPLGRVKAWAVPGGVSVLQQGLFAGSHFLTNVLLARWLAPASYGVFALAYSFFLLLLSLYMALFYEPVLVYGPGRYAGNFSAYVRILVRAHFSLLLPVSLLIAVMAPLFGRFYTHEFQVALLSLAVMAPLLLLVWLFRGAFYAQLNPHAGAVAGACYFALLLGSVWILHYFALLSAASALGGMTIASVLVCAGCSHYFRRHKRQETLVPKLKFARVVADHWRYGRWAVLTSVAIWLPGNIYYALLPARFGLESTALLRAMMNLMYPLLHTVAALVPLLIPILVRQAKQGGMRKMKGTVRQLIAMFVPVGILYLVILAAFRTPVLHLLYGGKYSTVSAWTVVFVGALPILAGVSGLLGAALRALEHSRLIFRSYLASTVVALAFGIPITLHFGVTGAALSLLVQEIPTILVLVTCLAKCRAAELATT